MIKKIAIIGSIVLLFASALQAAEPDYPILYSQNNKLNLKTCESGNNCTFSGTQKLSGKYHFYFDERCDSGEENGCFTLEFYPEDISMLPRFKGTILESIGITNYKETAQKLIGKALFNKFLATAKNRIKKIESDQESSLVLDAQGMATVVITDYSIYICCDSPNAAAKILEIKKKTKAYVKKAYINSK
jgi:hypothetical protein